MRTLEKNAIIFTKRDNSRNILWYLQMVEGKRPDVKIIVFPLPLWWAQYLKREFPDLDIKLRRRGKTTHIIKSNSGKYPVYSDNLEEGELRDFYDNWVPEGIVFRYSKEKRRDLGYDEIKRMNDIWDRYNFCGIFRINSPENRSVSAAR